MLNLILSYDLHLQLSDNLFIYFLIYRVPAVLTPVLNSHLLLGYLQNYDILLLQTDAYHIHRLLFGSNLQCKIKFQ